MKNTLQTYEFVDLLADKLLGSTMQQRKDWAQTLIKNNIDLKDLFPLLQHEHKIAIRFLWFLTEVGALDPQRLHNTLPALYAHCESLNPKYQQSFVSYWLIAGIPPEQEVVAVERCFSWLRSAATNTTIKSRCMWLLQRLIPKYPDLKNELRLSIEKQGGKYSQDFEKRANKILKELEA